MSDAEKVLEKVEECARAGALAAGAEIKLTRGSKVYANMVSNPVLADLLDANLQAVGRVVVRVEPNEPVGSTDMGNVSHVVPALHPFIQMVPEGTDGHTVEFREAAASPEGHAAMLDAAQVLAMTCVDLLVAPNKIEEAWDAHRRSFEDR
jgi:metal-dependent amidase/aminoacylase/carboxypeptidase family protein